MNTKNDNRLICKHDGCNNQCPPERASTRGHTIRYQQCATCSNLISKYGINGKQRLALLEQQDNNCAICSKEITFKGQTQKGDDSTDAAVVDHCHSTSKVRGILCVPCNRALGLFKDSTEILDAAKFYLKNHKADINMQRTIYLAGSMENVSVADATGWRDAATRTLIQAGCKVLDPCRRLHSFDPKSMKRIFELDMRDIQECDIIIANLEDPKLAKHGTAMEVFYMSYVLKKPVVAFKSDPKVIHPFFESLVTEWRSTAEKAVDTVISEYL